MWVKSDYLRVFLCLLQPISRPILFPLSVNKQPISLARSHNWSSLLSRTAVTYCSAPCDGIQSTSLAHYSSFTFNWQTMGTMDGKMKTVFFCDQTAKWPAALTRLLSSLRINQYETAAVGKPLLHLLLLEETIRGAPFHEFIKYIFWFTLNNLGIIQERYGIYMLWVKVSIKNA